LTTPYDVPATAFIKTLAKYLRDNVDAVTPPAWATMAKTGMHATKQPQDPSWWYTRSASILRKIYFYEPIGAEKLRSQYGGGKRKGGMPQHAAKSGGSIIRKSLQQLEAAGLIETAKPSGRKMTKNGKKLMQELAETAMKDIAKNNPALEKYQKGE
jgi:small subunit ribosomal protein S19e